MKKNSQRILSFLLSGIMVFASATSVLARSLNVENPNIREPLEKPTEEMFESLELEYGTMYLEENSEYRIVYIIDDIGDIDYSICYKDDPGVAHTGSYSPNSKEADTVDEASPSNLARTVVKIDSSADNVIDTILSLEPEKVVDFASRPQPRATIISTTDALNYAKNYAPGWKTPVNSRLVGAYRPNNITVNVYESVNGTVKRDNIFYYYANDTLISIISVCFKFNLTKAKNVITNVYNGARDLVAQKNGTLTYFTIDNTRTKKATINGTTYYWASWDMNYAVYSGDKKTMVEKTWDFAHSDYNNSVSYFGGKALSNYNNR